MDRKSIAPVIIAAGDSSRMGYPKALLPLGSGTFISRILSVLKELNLDIPTIVLGKHAARIQEAMADGIPHILINPNPADGQVSSVRIAVASLAFNCRGCLLWPVDLPLVSAHLAGSLVEMFLRSRAPLVMPCCGGKKGHPLIIGRELFPELFNPSLQEGVKTLIRRYERALACVATEEVASIQDIDTPEDYLKQTGMTLEFALENSRRTIKG